MTTYSSGEATKMKMINAAGDLAAELGIDNVSTRAVAERSGENIGSIHYHFGGKKRLWIAVIQEAMAECLQFDTVDELDELEKNATPQIFSKIIRRVIADEISNLFRSGRPDWCTQVLYQLMQRDDDLYELFRVGRLDPNMDFMRRLISMINPELDEEELFLHGSLMMMPIFTHANYRKAMLKRLGMTDYSDAYLKKLEDTLVKQALLLLELPEG